MTWWDENLPQRTKDYLEWIGNTKAESRVNVRGHVQDMGYKKLLDVGCGPGIDGVGYKEDGYEIDYLGVDSSPVVVEMAVKNGMKACTGISSKLHKLFDPKTFDVVTLRHVLEHLQYYKTSLIEAIEVARREVVVTWFIPMNQDFEDEIKFDAADTLYHNNYSKQKMLRWLELYPRVRDIKFVSVGTEEIMHVYLDP